MTDPLDNIKKMIDAERAALAPEKVAALEETEAMKAMMAIPEKADETIYEYGTLKIKHHRFLTKRLRLMLGQTQSTIQSSKDPLSEGDTQVYAILAEACTETPFSDPLFWKLTDLKFNDSRVYEIMFGLMVAMGGDESTLKGFRRKS
jgi:hypothetical protein